MILLMSQEAAGSWVISQGGKAVWTSKIRGYTMVATD
jgi:hypothetical protein